MNGGPARIQRKRTKGWRMPDGAIYVGRPTPFGNPFRPFKSACCPNWDVVDDNGVAYLIDHGRAHNLPHIVTTRVEATAESVRLFVDDLTHWMGGGRMAHDQSLAEAIYGLRGHDLACWCPIDQPCHADVLLEIANGPSSRPQPGSVPPSSTAATTERPKTVSSNPFNRPTSWSDTAPNATRKPHTPTSSHS